MIMRIIDDVISDTYKNVAWVEADIQSSNDLRGMLNYIEKKRAAYSLSNSILDYLNSESKKPKKIELTYFSNAKRKFFEINAAGEKQ